MFTLDPIGYFRSKEIEKYSLPRQGTIGEENEGVIHLNPRCQFEQALEGLEGFDRLWIIFRFHLHAHWKPKVLPPRGKKKRGVFATRSPHRPNGIGLTCVELKSVKQLQIHISNHDLVDGTPILDIKPYLNYADSFVSKRQGWVGELPSDNLFSIQWSVRAAEQLAYLSDEWGFDLKGAVEMRLQTNPYPSSNNRIKNLEGDHYCLAYQTWRVYFKLQNCEIFITSLSTGYDQETLSGMKNSRWPDVPMHQAYMQWDAIK
ncbi:MAG: tRNA (N6-threonylcarbamoyladenosine(37)-N6)-methyltransferase TrmO [Candidatus Protochlamydia sp.]|nr:tRNA (N6-threonylcarbamoyladenosine(37)-N6)-methyltransferase TrmO [Candidatus Protochlamydia sp.]